MNIFQYAYSVEQNYFKGQLADYGYKCFTTFYSDLTIGEVCEGIKGVKDTIKNVTKTWLNDYKYFTEWIMALNYKTWEMNHRIEKSLVAPKDTAENYLDFYTKEYYKAIDLFLEHYKDNEEAISYYYNTTD